jgi:hypothetical protein
MVRARSRPFVPCSAGNLTLENARRYARRHILMCNFSAGMRRGYLSKIYFERQNTINKSSNLRGA